MSMPKKKEGDGWMWLAWLLSTPFLTIAGVATTLYFALPFEVALWRLAIGVAGLGWLIQKAVRDGIEGADIWEWKIDPQVHPQRFQGG